MPASVTPVDVAADPMVGIMGIKVTVYETAGGKFVVTAEELDAGDRDEEPMPSYYHVYQHLLGIPGDSQLQELIEAPELWDWVTSLHRRHTEETATETWID